MNGIEVQYRNAVATMARAKRDLVDIENKVKAIMRDVNDLGPRETLDTDDLAGKLAIIRRDLEATGRRLR